MNKYNFDEVVNRRGTCSMKWDGLAARFGSDDPELIAMWVADMDFPSPPAVREELVKAAAFGFYGYPKAIAQESMSAMCAWFKRRLGWEADPSLAVYAPDTVVALCAMVQEFTDAGEYVMIQSPVYAPFFSVVERNGRKILDNTLVQDENGIYVMDYHDMESKLKEYRPKLFLFCSPQNPTGRVWLEEELSTMLDLCRKYGVTIASDEVHADFVYKGRKHLALATLPHEDVNLVTCVSPHKNFNIGGLKSAAMIAEDSKTFERLSMRMKNLNISNDNLFSLIATEVAYRTSDDWMDELVVYLEENARLIVEELKKYAPQVKVTLPEGTYTAWIDCRGTDLEGAALQDFFIKEAKVAVVEGSIYGSAGSGFIRMNFACPRATLQAALNNIKAVLKKLAFSNVR